MLLLLTGAVVAHASSPPGNRGNNHSVLRTVENAGGVSLSQRAIGQAHALAPADWQGNSSPQGDAVDFTSPDGRCYAGWGVVAINRAMQPYYGDLYGAPETSMRYLLSQQVRTMGDASSVRFTSGPTRFDSRGYLLARQFESDAHRGLIIYHIYPGPAGSGPNDYVESLYVALTAKSFWAKKGGLAINVACSIRGSVQLLNASPAPHRKKSADDDDPSTYNMQLGWEYCHSASGQNYLVDHTACWNDNGPDGPGYYRKVGNNYEKLIRGLSD